MNRDEQSFYSNGKLLLTGEYVVLDGAKALALPTKFGQSLKVVPSEGNAIKWVAFDCDQTVWLDEMIEFSEISSFSGLATVPRERLIRLLHEAWKISPVFLEKKGWNIETQLTFPRHWGLGSSSTLINNLAQWLNIDPYELLRRGFGGSGYDIGCAQNSSPIKYTLRENQPTVELSSFDPKFADKLYFVYLNRKQSSREAIDNYRSRQPQEIDAAITGISQLTDKIESLTDFAEFCSTLKLHEQTIAKLIDQPTIQEQLFADFTGTIKSLGAWGGDFILAAADGDPSDYFYNRGYNVVIRYDKIILK